MDYRRFELLEKDAARIEELEAILNRAELSRYELALNLDARKILADVPQEMCDKREGVSE